MTTPTLSYRDVLNQTFDDKELVEFLVGFIDDYKSYGAWRMKPLPSHVTVCMIDKIKTLLEQQLAFYPAKGTAAANDDDFEAQNPPDVAYSDPK